MSVTFSPASTTDETPHTYAVVCSSGEEIGQYRGYQNAYSEAQAHSLVCDIDLCRQYGADVDRVFVPGEPRPVNMSSRNAADVLRSIGLCPPVGDGLYGEMPARAFLDLVATAIAVGVSDPEKAEMELDGSVIGLPGARYIDSGRGAGYITGKLCALRGLAEACVRTGVDTITWG